METFNEIKARLGRNPWGKVKYYQPGTWLSKGGWKTVRGLEREIKNEIEYLAVQKAQRESIFFLEQFFPIYKINDALRIVVE